MFQRLVEKIGAAGQVIEDYGGYEIVVTDNEGFPWHGVFDLLNENGFQIWIDKGEDGRIRIMSKPEVN